MERRTIAWIVTIVVFVLLVIASLAAGGSGTTFDVSDAKVGFSTTVERDDGTGSASVAIVPVVGTIVDGESDPGQGLVGADTFVSLMDSLIEDDVDAIVLEIDSPGGAVIASDEMAAAVGEAREAGIQVIAWMRSSAASGGYYVAARAEQIIAHPATITGSIGVILSYPNIGPLSEDVGIDWIVVKSGSLKDIASPFRDLTAEERRILQDLIDEAYEDFVGVVASGRGMPDGEVRTLADGRIYTGRQAQANGLVDELGGLDEVYAALEDNLGAELNVVRYERELSFADIFSIESPRFVAPNAAEIAEELRRSGMPQLEYRAAL